MSEKEQTATAALPMFSPITRRECILSLLVILWCLSRWNPTLLFLREYVTGSPHLIPSCWQDSPEHPSLSAPLFFWLNLTPTDWDAVGQGLTDNYTEYRLSHTQDSKLNSAFIWKAVSSLFTPLGNPESLWQYPQTAEQFSRYVTPWQARSLPFCPSPPVMQTAVKTFHSQLDQQQPPRSLQEQWNECWNKVHIIQPCLLAHPSS